MRKLANISQFEKLQESSSVDFGGNSVFNPPQQEDVFVNNIEVPLMTYFSHLMRDPKANVKDRQQAVLFASQAEELSRAGKLSAKKWFDAIGRSFTLNTLNTLKNPLAFGKWMSGVLNTLGFRKEIGEDGVSRWRLVSGGLGKQVPLRWNGEEFVAGDRPHSLDSAIDYWSRVRDEANAGDIQRAEWLKKAAESLDKEVESSGYNYSSDERSRLEQIRDFALNRLKMAKGVDGKVTKVMSLGSSEATSSSQKPDESVIESKEEKKQEAPKVVPRDKVSGFAGGSTSFYKKNSPDKLVKSGKGEVKSSKSTPKDNVSGYAGGSTSFSKGNPKVRKPSETSLKRSSEVSSPESKEKISQLDAKWAEFENLEKNPKSSTSKVLQCLHEMAQLNNEWEAILKKGGTNGEWKKHRNIEKHVKAHWENLMANGK